MEYTCICASHITSDRRLNALKDQIKSIQEQTVKPKVTVIGLSSTDDMKEQVDSLVIELEKDNIVIVRNKPQTQFQHIESVINSGVINTDICVIVDDDDTCHVELAEKQLEY